MIDTNALKCEIVRNGLSQRDVAIHLRMNPETFYRKMRKGVFGSDEMEGMIDLLNLQNPCAIFFAKKVS